MQPPHVANGEACRDPFEAAFQKDREGADGNSGKQEGGACDAAIEQAIHACENADVSLARTTLGDPGRRCTGEGYREIFRMLAAAICRCRWKE